MRPAQPNQSLIDGLSVLQALAAHGTPIGSRELARMLGLEPTRANRLLKTLALVGLAQQDAARRYAPGPGIHVLAAQSLRGSGLIGRALGPLEELRSRGHVIAMGVLWWDQVSYLYHAGAGAEHGRGIGGEALFPAAQSGLGHALLAELSDEEIREIYSDGHRLHATRPDNEAVVLDGEDGLLAAIEGTRRRGYALTGVYGAEDPTRTIGVVVGDPVVAAIGMSGDFTDDEVPELVDALRATAGRIAVA
ncbi:hypothetical protein GCM10009809_22910 [Isoptericola hypogeus]|uniref:IclR family transcriptional regulator n=1 Tax=Isoptericola hypogeus TaxID=300179 RepID=A0ABN2JGP6_9MICO